MTCVSIMRSLCQVWKPEWQGLVMAELAYLAGHRKSAGTCDITIKEGRLIRLRAVCPESGESMTMILLPQKLGEVKKEKNGEYWRTFSSEAVRKFSQDLGDHNEIHQGEHPIVSGFQLLVSLQQDFSFLSGRIRFYAPVKAGEAVYIEKTETGYIGYTEQRCFIVEESK